MACRLKPGYRRYKIREVKESMTFAASMKLLLEGFAD